MSEKRIIEIDLTDLDLIEEVIKDIPDIFSVKNIKPKLFYGYAKETCDLTAMHKNSRFEVGFLQEENKIKMIFDTWKNIAQDTIISKVISRYQEKIISKKLRSSRFKIQKREETASSIILTLK